jgi:preprotein translocase subunit SecG
MGGVMQIFIFILVILFFALLLGYIARKKGADTFYWTVMGGLFGPFAIPFILFAKPHNQSSDCKPPTFNTTEQKR